MSDALVLTRYQLSWYLNAASGRDEEGARGTTIDPRTIRPICRRTMLAACSSTAIAAAAVSFRNSLSAQAIRIASIRIGARQPPSRVGPRNPHRRGPFARLSERQNIM